MTWMDVVFLMAKGKKAIYLELFYTKYETANMRQHSLSPDEATGSTHFPVSPLKMSLGWCYRLALTEDPARPERAYFCSDNFTYFLPNPALFCSHSCPLMRHQSRVQNEPRAFLEAPVRGSSERVSISGPWFLPVHHRPPKVWFSPSLSLSGPTPKKAFLKSCCSIGRKQKT